MGLAYDAGHDTLVMFGSQYLSDERTWLYDLPTNRWEGHELAPHPPARKGTTYSTIPRMAYDSVNGVILCVVWLDEQKGHETWALDVGTLQWTELNPAAEHNVFVLETSSAKTDTPEIWTFRYRIAPAAVAPAVPTELQAITSSAGCALSWKASASAGVGEYSPDDSR